MLFHHFYDTGFYCIYCILYLEQVFIVYIVLHTVNRSGIDLNKDDYYYIVFYVSQANMMATLQTVTPKVFPSIDLDTI